MARGKFNKRGGGPRLDAQSAEEIEQRNQRLAELEEQRAERRAAEDEDEEDDNGGNDDTVEAVKESKQVVEKKDTDKKSTYTGPTAEEYKRDMKKLAEVRARREAAEARKKAEREAEEETLEEQRRLAAEVTGGGEGAGKKKKKPKEEKIPKLDKITIKKMKPAQMKEALKVRGLEIQGNAKTLTDRLLKYEAER